MRQTFTHARSSKLIPSFILFLAGALSGLALPPVGFWWVLLTTIPLLLWRLETVTPRGWRSAFWAGLSFGFGYFCAAFHWIGFAFFVNAADIWMMPFAVGGLALFMACYWAIALAVAARVPLQVAPGWLSALLVLSVAEWLRGHLFTGFPWGVPGLAADGMGGVAQVASLVGANGLTVLLLVWSALPFVIWRKRRNGVAALALPVLVLALLPLSHLWGLWRLSSSPTVFHDSAIVRLVQPNISQDDKWRSDNSVAIFDTLTRLSSAGPDAGAVTHVVWPESSVPFLLDEDKVARERIASLLSPGRTLLAGAIRREVDATCATCPDLYFTSILMMNDAGAVSAAYDKWRLVPGGEYLPLESFLSRFGFRKVVSLPESFTAGEGPRNLDVPGLGPAGMLICYEVIFSHALVNAVRPNLLVNVTNDGWFEGSVGPHQHLAQARMRSIEQGLPLLRSANTGISAVIDPMGRLLAQTGLEQSIYLDSRIPVAGAVTPYARWGDAVMFCLLLALLVVLRGTGSLVTPRQPD